MIDRLILVLIVTVVTIASGTWWFLERKPTHVTAVDSARSTSVPRAGLEVVGESMVDLGKFNAGEPIGYHFELRNVLDREVMILAVNPNCGCMSIPESLLRKPISSGETVEVPVILKTEGRSGELSGMVRILCGHKPVADTKITQTS